MAQLTDRFGRHIEYVRLSVTDQCDLRCFYCMPKGFKDFEEPEHWLSFDEIARVMGAFGQLGVQRVRITGGEPLVRKDIPDLVSRLAALPGINDISLSTNATRMAKHAQALKDAGVARINVSLDSLKPEVFKQVTGGKLEKVLDGLMAAKAAGFSPIKINMVAMKGVNDGEFEDMVEFCLAHGFTLRFIETMPMGDTGRHASADHYVNLQDVKARLAERFELVPGVMPGGGPARYMQVAGTDLKIGFITPISQHFCETCNRVRLSVDGTIYTCLGQEHNLELRPLLRAGCSDAELLEAIQRAVDLKPERHEFKDEPGKVMRFMSMTGG
ncbi:GTP cyclohydrolase subunit MoaA [Thioalkalivibrio sulfidiphilus HL-EbGr7]|uniref:GTP 3',8-cyclase n=1 Tax=Thioalkalivibrio sulfidiphilus (strain HL-EbGR7) TaxID=396588 RepID=B8GUS3_THISH|nr:GTP 3',8-cyclase MoaA [Thioalkalivibrio sulfidiphilus]ACL71434.1 GTP cyclohydrolase subunit MoaA [Thioalkalivibrio sulfidiphilus HL-EbGr7]